MTTKAAQETPAIGFLTVVEDEAKGYFGGYLLLNMSGRPLEFHCTAPVKPNRAQEILYGPTLAPFLHGELIGRTLVDKAKVKPLVVCTDVPTALSVRESINLPTMLTLETGNREASQLHLRFDESHDQAASNAPKFLSFTLEGKRVAISSLHAEDEARLRELATEIAEIDLQEPFERIREAIREAQGAGR